MLRVAGKLWSQPVMLTTEGNFPFIERLVGSENLVNLKRHYACGVGSDECVRSILAYGADVNAKVHHAIINCFSPSTQENADRIKMDSLRYTSQQGIYMRRLSKS